MAHFLSSILSQQPSPASFQLVGHYTQFDVRFPLQMDPLSDTATNVFLNYLATNSFTSSAKLLFHPKSPVTLALKISNRHAVYCSSLYYWMLATVIPKKLPSHFSRIPIIDYFRMHSMLNLIWSAVPFCLLFCPYLLHFHPYIASHSQKYSGLNFVACYSDTLDTCTQPEACCDSSYSICFVNFKPTCDLPFQFVLLGTSDTSNGRMYKTWGMLWSFVLVEINLSVTNFTHTRVIAPVRHQYSLTD